MKNFSINEYYPHKKDTTYYEISYKTTIFQLYVTKIFKIVKIKDSKSNEFVFDFNIFFILLFSGICKKNLCQKFGIRNFKIKYDRIKFTLFKKNEILFEISYKKSKTFIMQNLKLLYSYILSSKSVQHIENKRYELNQFAIEYLQREKKETNFILHFLSLEKKNIFKNVLDIKDKQIIKYLIVYSYLKEEN